MTDILEGSVIRMFRLTNGPGGFGLSCNPDGLFLASTPLLTKTPAGFEPRPASEIAALIKAAYGASRDQIRLQSSLGSIARALNGGDFALAAITAVQTRTPELTADAAARLANADRELTKYNFDPDEPRDRHGRWTTDEIVGQESIAVPGIASDASPSDMHVAIGDDMMRSIVKNACIAECSESSLSTHNYGWKFFNCVNDCMRRHGHDPFLFRLS